MIQQPNQIPNSGKETVVAAMKIQSFVSKPNPTPKQVEEYNNEVNEFLQTIDNVNRFLNGRNAYSNNGTLVTVIWYLERLKDEPITTPFGSQNGKHNPTQDTKN